MVDLNMPTDQKDKLKVAVKTFGCPTYFEREFYCRALAVGVLLVL
jgi:hypothetical protein